jgi:hypothetical protein
MNKTKEEMSRNIEEFVRKSMLVILNSRINSNSSNGFERVTENSKVNLLNEIILKLNSSVLKNARVLT